MRTARSRARAAEIAAVDLFCGAGGLTHGLLRAGVRVVAGIDLDPHCKFPFVTNNAANFLEGNVRELSGADLEKLWGNASTRLLAGCAPCQPFSTYSRKGRKVREDEKWDLVADFGRLVRESKPELVTIENVPQLADHAVFKDFLRSLDGYSIWWRSLECSELRIPQTRKRLVLLASRLGPIQLSALDLAGGHMTVRGAIAHLPALAAGETNAKDRLHTASALSPLNLRRIRASKPGGTWRDWEKSLVAKCHRKETGETYPSVYGRMEWDAPAPTITTQCFGFGNGRFGHPEQDRAISLREAAILQTFPDDYQFVRAEETVSFNRLGRLIGNAVPVRLGEIVGCSLMRHLKDNSTVPSRRRHRMTQSKSRKA